MSPETDRMADLFASLPRLQTKRLLLRPVEMTDAEAVYAYASDPEVTRYSIFETHRSIDDAHTFLLSVQESRANRTGACWGLVVRAEDRLIGTLGLHHYEPSHRRIEVGYAIARKEWNKGYTTEALRAAIDCLFRMTDVNRIEAHCYVPNIASAKVMEKAGMRYEGTMLERVCIKGIMQDIRMYGILRRDHA